jgi:hypothetical protein
MQPQREEKKKKRTKKIYGIRKDKNNKKQPKDISGVNGNYLLILF